VLTNWNTWRLLGVLSFVSFLTMGVVFATNSQDSISVTDITARLQVLLSFVLASYVGLSVSRWDKLRNNTLGQLWGSLENIYMIVAIAKDDTTNANDMKVRETVLRLCRATMRCLFKAANNEVDLQDLLDEGLLTPKEVSMLEPVICGTRSLTILGWLQVDIYVCVCVL
jgi:hypothetical protein